MFKKIHKLISTTGGEAVCVLRHGNGDTYVYCTHDKDWRALLKNGYKLKIEKKKSIERMAYDNTVRTISTVKTIDGKVHEIIHKDTIIHHDASHDSDDANVNERSLLVMPFTPQAPTPAKRTSQLDGNFMPNKTPEALTRTPLGRRTINDGKKSNLTGTPLGRKTITDGTKHNPRKRLHTKASVLKETSVSKTSERSQPSPTAVTSISKTSIPTIFLDRKTTTDGTKHHPRKRLHTKASVLKETSVSQTSERSQPSTTAVTSIPTSSSLEVPTTDASVSLTAGPSRKSLQTPAAPVTKTMRSILNPLSSTTLINQKLQQHKRYIQHKHQPHFQPRYLP